MKTIISTSMTALLLSGPMNAIADQGTWYSSDHMWGSGSWMWGGMYMWLALIALLVLVHLFSRSSQSSDTDGTAQPIVPTALDILNARYARGEINQQVYETIKQELNK